MKVVQINAVYGHGSTGKICMSISNVLNEHGVENYILYSAGKGRQTYAISCCNMLYTKLQAVKSRVLGNYGFNSVRETKRMISLMSRIQPDVVHLHNVHGHDCHLEMLFDYFKRNRIKVFWTFHDCWAFTGYCTHFAFESCDKWKTECVDCVQRRKYSYLFDRSNGNFLRKRSAFSGAELTIITPSQWLADLVGQSFLKEFPTRVINNGIDLDIFKPRPSNFHEKYHVDRSKHILLGVASGWGIRKGLDVFIELAQRLDNSKYQIVLVGTDKKTEKLLPENVISICRTNNQIELAEIYSAADLFVNPTREDTYPTVNMEAIACGVPVLTFQTGGSPEIVTKKTGAVVAIDDIDAMEQEIIRICRNKPFALADCLMHAQRFSARDRFHEYMELYGVIKQ